MVKGAPGYKSFFVCVPQMYEEYDDNEIGALDEDEIEGAVDNSKELLNSVLEEYERDKKQAQMWVKNFIYMFQYFCFYT